MISAEMKFMRRTAKYTWKDYKTNENILSELKINPAVKKIQNCGNNLVQHVRWMDRDRLAHLVMKYEPCGKQSQGWTYKRLLDC